MPRNARPPARPLDLAAPAHGGVLLGDGQKLEPDALRLERARHQLGREAVGIGAALEHRLDLGLMLAHHLEEEREQELGRFLGRGAADQCLHRLGRSRLLGDLLVHGGLTHSRSRRSADRWTGVADMERRSPSIAYNAIRPVTIVMPGRVPGIHEFSR